MHIETFLLVTEIIVKRGREKTSWRERGEEQERRGWEGEKNGKTEGEGRRREKERLT